MLFRLIDEYYKKATEELLEPTGHKSIKEVLDQVSSTKSFSGRMKLCKDNFRYLTSGSARSVFILPDGKVLKLAKNVKGVAQNATESDYMTQTPVTNKVYDSDPNDLWIVTDLAKKTSKGAFKAFTGMNFDEYALALKYWDNERRGTRSFFSKPNNYEKILDNEFFGEVIELMGNFDMPAGDFARINSYGEVNGKIVLVDYGLTDDIFKEFYSK